MKPRLELTQKAWKRFDYNSQRHLLTKFDVIITDHHTKRETLAKIFKSFNVKNMNTGIARFQDGMDQFSKEMEKLHDSLNDGKVIDLDKQFWGARSDRSDNPDRGHIHDIFWGKRSNSII